LLSELFAGNIKVVANGADRPAVADVVNLRVSGVEPRASEFSLDVGVYTSGTVN
jgi:hypothetical protein